MEPCWHQNGIKSRFLRKHETLMPHIGFRRSKLGANIDKNSIKQCSQHGKASLHRFFIDFGGFGEPSWDAKSSRHRFIKASKKG